MISVEERSLMLRWYRQLRRELPSGAPALRTAEKRHALLRAINPATLPSMPSPRQASAA
jgi:hypothetical protein